MWMARRAGMRLPVRAIRTQRAMAAAKVGTSAGSTPASRARMLLPASQAAAAPNRMPAAERRAASREDHAEDVAALRSEREAHADFLGAAGHGEGEQAVNADGGEQEGDGGEGGERAHLYGARFGFGFDDIAEHAHVGDGQLGIGGGDDAAQRGNDGSGRGGSAQNEVLGHVPDDVAIGDLLIRDVDLRLAFAFRVRGRGCRRPRRRWCGRTRRIRSGARADSRPASSGVRRIR